LSKNLKAVADAAAAFLKQSVRKAPEGDALRDFLDGWTQGDLDCVQLDILTDMVTKRLSRPAGSNADEWHLFLCQHLDNRATSPSGLQYVALQIAEAIEAAGGRP
jgi:hypothetical protein